MAALRRAPATRHAPVLDRRQLLDVLDRHDLLDLLDLLDRPPPHQLGSAQWSLRPSRRLRAYRGWGDSLPRSPLVDWTR